MEIALRVLRGLHVAVGFIGLFAFWFPVFARKGSRLHRRMGQVFRWSAFFVLSAAACALALEMIKLGTLQQGPQQRPETWAFLVFLSYLTMITAVMLSHGIAVLRSKRDLTQLNSAWRRFQARAAISTSLLVIAWALYWSPTNAVLLYALSPIGLLNGLGILRVIEKPSPQPKQWLLEHLGAFLGCGIAYHTAFSVFGASRLFDYHLSGWSAVIPWILPSVLGIPAIVLWSRYYQNQGKPSHTAAHSL